MDSSRSFRGRICRELTVGRNHNQDHESAKLAMPVLSIGGANSRLNKYVVDQLRAATTRLTGDLTPQSGHWIPQRQPEWLARRLMEFIAAH